MLHLALTWLNFYSRVNQGQMLVTFADSHSALSVLDVDGMKVSRAWSAVPRGLLTPQGFLVLLRGHGISSPCL